MARPALALPIRVAAVLRLAVSGAEHGVQDRRLLADRHGFQTQTQQMVTKDACMHITQITQVQITDQGREAPENMQDIALEFSSIAGITFMEVNRHGIGNFRFGMQFFANEIVANQFRNERLIKVNTPHPNQPPQDSVWS